MKQTNKVLSAILFCILLVGLCGTVSAINVYQTIVPFKSETGHLYVTVLCHHNLFSKEMVLVNDLAPDVNISVFLRPDGTFDGRFIAGNYTLTLLDGNAGHPEIKKFKITNGYRQDVILQGHAVTFDHIEKNVTPVCNPTLNIVSAFYGFFGANCYNNTIIDVPAHTEYSYWISGTPAHTEYRFSDYVPTTYHEVCYPEVNHTEYQISTYIKISNEIPAWTEYFGDYNKVDGHYVYAGHDMGDYDLTFEYHWFKCYDYKPQGDHYVYDHNDGHYSVKTSNKVGHINHPAIPAVYDWVITTPFTDGACPMRLSCCPHVGDTRCVERIVVDVAAHCEQEILAPGYQGEFSDWSDIQPEEQNGRIIESREVPDDMVNGYYSDWSDIPEGSCVQALLSCVDIIVNEPCQTREVPAVTHEETVCVDVGGMADVTQNVKDVVASGHTSFVFDNRPSSGGIFDIVGGTLLSPIPDPAPGYVKIVEITFNMGCDSQDQTVAAGEHEVINLAPIAV